VLQRLLVLLVLPVLPVLLVVLLVLRMLRMLLMVRGLSVWRLVLHGHVLLIIVTVPEV
jgi:hypothetical protein